MNNTKNYQTPEGFDTKKDSVAYGELTELEYNSKTTGNTRKCFVYTPPGYTPAVTYPVMYLLHGIGGTHTEWLGGAPNEVISNLIAQGEAKPMIVVIPNIRASYDDTPPPEGITPENIAACDNFINDLRDDLMPFIKERYSISDKRGQCAVAGLSMGGRESLFIGVKMPETFGYIGAFSPAPGLLPMEHPNDRKHKGQLTAEEMTLPEAYRDNTFILMCSGTEEEMFNHIAAAYRKAFDGNGVKYEYYITPGGHDFRTWKNGLYHFVKNIFQEG
jgi:enterochelin esterase-like enzyme